MTAAAFDSVRSGLSGLDSQVQGMQTNRNSKRAGFHLAELVTAHEAAAGPANRERLLLVMDVYIQLELLDNCLDNIVFTDFCSSAARQGLNSALLVQ